MNHKLEDKVRVKDNCTVEGVTPGETIEIDGINPGWYGTMGKNKEFVKLEEDDVEHLEDPIELAIKADREQVIKWYKEFGKRPKEFMKMLKGEPVASEA